MPLLGSYDGAVEEVQGSKLGAHGAHAETNYPPNLTNGNLGQ